MNKTVVAAVGIAAAAAIVGGAACYFLCNFKKYEDTQTVTVGDGESLKVGIISDSQLPANGFAGIFNRQELTDRDGELRNAMAEILE